MHREVEQVGGTYALRESSEAFGRGFVEGKCGATAGKHDPWQKFAETAET
jgi:hypothetical protein